MSIFTTTYNNVSILVTKNHASKDSGMADVDIVSPDTQETMTLLNTSQNPKAEQQQTTNRLENTVDSLLDVRLEALKKSSTDRERFLNDSDSNRRSSDTNDTLTPFEYLDRAELMCCYVLYFCLLFVLVVFGIAYVWLPIIQGIVYDKHKNTTRLIDRQNYR